MLPFNTYAQKLRVGVSPYDPPFVIQTTPNHYSGFDIAMMNYVCLHIGYECQFISIRRARLIEAVAKGEVDLAVSNLNSNRTPYKNVLYSLPYLVTSTHIIGLADFVKANFDPSLMNNTHIGITDESYVKEIRSLKIIKPKIVFFPQDDDMISALTDKKIQFALVDAYTAAHWENSSSGLIKDYDCPQAFEWASSIAINPKKILLQKEINKILTDYRNSPQFLNDFEHNLLHLNDKK
jgi:ABC-type amino acid transport substrate-binding protein